MKIHKIEEGLDTTKCGKAWEGKQGVYHWKYVTCKNCLKLTKKIKDLKRLEPSHFDKHSLRIKQYEAFWRAKLNCYREILEKVNKGEKWA